ncbi:hypothetical protein [Natronobacterium gregoryi]|uniref:Uncharacterized protein n=2 Tax=Natronobacterium gregoryi TaxID=44930 RepID=L0AIT1_NATGS|nr:hypothetical protein [Natronobacterium gregoryi]AFZ73077.1 hypothetical protein Natgr_1892 [Natronobacterium gregoryi SP2]ELY70822.1 hypothetical protein C490_06012 [Natronobacterium gregoryi SP2]PLK20402.1 hypothetical protein CYV19_09755 [Natronobacterium gregoryi SP2]SFI61795.1 hypothetical protein SAMN05443661_102189 [Natronobacterium gregoryi]
MFYRLRFHLARAVAVAICEPQMRLGRRRHDNYCDECGEHCGRYFADKLDFPLDNLEPEATSKWEKLRAMFNADYMRVCLECSVELEAAESENSTGNEGGEQA